MLFFPFLKTNKFQSFEFKKVNTNSSHFDMNVRMPDQDSRNLPLNFSVSLSKISIQQLTFSARGWAKYRDLSAASRSIICGSRRLRQIIDLQDTDKSWYFAITEFDKCVIIRSPSLFSYFNHFLAAQGSDLPFLSRERGSSYAWAEYYLQQNTFKRYHA